ncbi:MAG: hypothetical protein ACKO0Z_20970 [Betaproteobacteria bacterium]
MDSTPPDAQSKKLDDHEVRINALERAHSVTEKTVAEIKKDTSEIVTLIRDAQGAWRFFEMLGKTARPIAWIASMVAAAGVVWAQIKNGKL